VALRLTIGISNRAVALSSGRLRSPAGHAFDWESVSSVSLIALGVVWLSPGLVKEIFLRSSPVVFHHSVKPNFLIQYVQPKLSIRAFHD
jgi:hypothetical protein